MLGNFVPPNLFPASTEIFLLVMILVILLIGVGQNNSKRDVIFWFAQFSLVGSAVITLLTSDGQVSYTFSGMFVDDLLADLLKLLLLLSVSLSLFYGKDYVNSSLSTDRGAFFVLVLCATLGMMVMVSANHFVTVYLGLELLSLSLYALVAIKRNSTLCAEAAMKYFVLGAIASGLLLYGMSMIYGATGTLEITQLADVLYGDANTNRVVLTLGLVFIVAGIAFKLGVVPFHMWVPDVYEGAPTVVTLLISSAPKLAVFAILIRLLVSGLIALSPDWQDMLMVMSILSMAVGNIAAIAQTNIKRMLAYSAISHMGFMLLGMISGVVGGDARYALNAYSSSLFYIVVYVLTSLAAFGVVLLLARTGFEAENLTDYKGLNQRSPWFAAVMLMVMFSMAGIPFFVGFFAKFSVLQAVVAAGKYGLAIASVLFSLIGAFYYLRVVKYMYFDDPIDTSPIVANDAIRILLSLNGIALAALGLFPQILMSLCAFALLRSL